MKDSKYIKGFVDGAIITILVFLLIEVLKLVN